MNSQTKAVATARQMTRHTATATRAASRGAWWVARRYGWAWRGLWRILARLGLWVITPQPGVYPIPLMLGKILVTGIGCVAASVGLVMAAIFTAHVTLSVFGDSIGWVILKMLTVAFVVGVVALFARAGRPAVLDDEPAGDVYTNEQERLCQAIAATVAGITGTQAVPAASKVGVSNIVGHWNDQGQHVGRQFVAALPIGTVWDQLNNPRTRGAIAHVLNSRTDRVTITEGASPGRAHVMVADLSPSEIPTPAWPLLNTSRFDLRQPVPIGQAINGGPVGLRLFSTDSDGDLQAHHGIVFGETGSGKSNLARLLVLAAVLDPAARVHVAQKAGSKDFRKLAPVLDWLGDITDTERVTGMLRDAVAHMRAVRAGQTPEVPYLVVLEEAQNVLASKGSGCNPEIKALTKTLLAEGRDASICVVIVTQRPTSASVDQDVAQRPPNRLAFTVNGHTDADLAMGAKLNDRNNPMAAPQFAVGVHINGSLDAVVMVPEVSGKDVERIAGRATPRAAEPAAQPVATETPGRPDGLLDHALSVGAEGAETDRASIRYLLVRMQAAYPDIYDTDEWKMRDPDTAELIPDPGKLTKALRRAGVNVSTIKVDGKPARGCYLVDVMRAMSPTPAP